MVKLDTSFMGIEMKSPVIVGACPISKKIDSMKKAEDAGAGAIVIHSLFQEQIEKETEDLDEELMIGSESYAESITYFPHLEHSGSREHIMWIEKARKQIKLPLIGSLNATDMGNWLEYAVHLQNAGCNGLELNLYTIETNPQITSVDIEAKAYDIVAAVKSRVNIPVAVKLSPWQTSMANFAAKIVDAGADALVLFNRFYQPTIDIENETLEFNMELSRSEDSRLPMRWISILSRSINTDFAASTGVHSGKDAIAYLLAGAKAVQCVSSLLKNGISHISTINFEIEDWMQEKGYCDIEEFRGNINQSEAAINYKLERAHYSTILSSVKTTSKALGIAAEDW